MELPFESFTQSSSVCKNSKCACLSKAISFHRHHRHMHNRLLTSAWSAAGAQYPASLCPECWQVGRATPVRCQSRAVWLQLGRVTVFLCPAIPTDRASFSSRMPLPMLAAQMETASLIKHVQFSYWRSQRERLSERKPHPIKNESNLAQLLVIRYSCKM